MSILLLLLSCSKPVDLKSALDPADCFSSLRAQLEANDCKKLSYLTTDVKDIMIRCHKQDADRKNEWDTYIFRLSYTEIPIPEGAEEFINKYKICEDSEWRIEAYPPKKVK